MPPKGKKPKGQGGKKTDGTSKPTDKKSSETAEKKHGASATSASTSAAAASSSKVPTSQERTMKPADTKPKPTPKPEPAKSTQTTVPKSTTTTSSTGKPSTEKVPTKKEGKAVPRKQKSDTTVTSGAVGKAAAASVVATSKPKDVVKEEKKTVSVAQIATEPATGDQDALDLLIDSLGGPEDVPQSPKFTGPEIADTPAISEYLEELGKRDSTIPPEYRHLLDGKGEKPAPPPPKEAEKSLGDDDLVAAFSSDFVTCQSPPEEKKPKLEELQKKAAKPTSSAPAAPTQPSAPAMSDDALDELLGTLESPPTSEPELPEVYGPEVTETITSTYREELGKRDHTIPPAYRHLLDGKDDGKPVPPPAEQPPPMSDTSLVDEFSKDFESCISPAAKTAPAFQPKDAAQDKQAKSDVVVPSTGSSVQTSTAPSAGMESALDELMGTLEGPEFSVPDSPVYTGPEVTETSTATYLEELGKRESSIPPEYRHLLDGKEGGKPVPPVPEEKSMSDSELVDAFDKEFGCPEPAAAQQTPPVKPKDAPEVKKKEADVVVGSSSSSALQAPSAPSKTPAGKTKPLDATSGKRKEDPKDKKPATDKVKDAAKDKQAKSDVVVPSTASSVKAATAPSAGMESALDELMGTLEGPEFSVPDSPVYTGPEVTETSTATYLEELGKRESSIPPEYRHLLDGKEGGKPVPPVPEEKSMSDSELVDAFDKEFGCPEPAAAQQTPPVKPKDAPEVKKKEADVVVGSSSSSALQAAPSPSKTPAGKDDPLDALAGTLGKRKEDPKDKKPVADKVKEKTGKENKEKLGEDEKTIPPDYKLKEVKDKDGKPLLPKPEEKSKAMSEDELLDALTEGFDIAPAPSQCAPVQSSAKAPGKSEETISCSKASAVQSSAAKPSASIPDDALDLLSGSLGERQPDPDENKPVVDVVKEKAKEEHIDKLGDRDDTIPPEYRHLLDGKDQGKPAKPEVVKPKKSVDDAAAIDLLSSGFASCETSSTDKMLNSSKDKVQKSSSSTPVSKASGKVPEPSKDKVEKSSSVHKTQASGKVQDSSKSSTQSSLEKSSAQKTSKS
ncbi:calpastatin isoform X1 [Bufo bufo]|uniref:calpastatin isoform X1 n=2 Tax=Bufo bufo TaxID=8384 RepID=UPI001ABE15F1|nr:calpastatin isoform X1 [Bufo bufo]XP_040277497.1 calpastatin isoform X1 [Bufo bufo]